MSQADRYLPHYHVDDYQQWQGIPVSMTPSPFGRHQKIAMRLATMLQNSVDKTGCPAVVLAEIDWIVSRTTVVRPDILVLCGDAPEKHVENRAEMIVEVISDRTRELDCNHKFNLYRREGVTYYLLADPKNHSLDLFRQDGGGNYERQTTEGEMTLEICDRRRLSMDGTRVFS